jgi:hypothetical protein
MGVLAVGAHPDDIELEHRHPGHRSDAVARVPLGGVAQQPDIALRSGHEIDRRTDAGQPHIQTDSTSHRGRNGPEKARGIPCFCSVG